MNKSVFKNERVDLCNGASSFYTPTFFFLHLHNFKNPKIDLDQLFEKGYWSFFVTVYLLHSSQVLVQGLCSCAV